MKINNFLKTIKEIWPIASAIGVLFFYIIFYSINMQFEIKKQQFEITNVNKSIIDEHKIMKSYVDAQYQAFNIKIDNLSDDVEKTNETVVLMNQRIDSTLTQFMQINKETSDRIDKILISVSSKYQKG